MVNSTARKFQVKSLFIKDQRSMCRIGRSSSKRSLARPSDLLLGGTPICYGDHERDDYLLRMHHEAKLISDALPAKRIRQWQNSQFWYANVTLRHSASVWGQPIQNRLWHHAIRQNGASFHAPRDALSEGGLLGPFQNL